MIIGENSFENLWLNKAGFGPIYNSIDQYEDRRHAPCVIIYNQEANKAFYDHILEDDENKAPIITINNSRYCGGKLWNMAASLIDLKIPPIIYGPKIKDKITYVDYLLKPSGQLLGVKDVFISPLYIADLIASLNAILDRVRQSKSLIFESYNLSGPEYVDYYTWAQIISKVFYIKEPIIPITSFDLKLNGIEIKTSEKVNCSKFFRKFKLGRKRIGLKEGAMKIKQCYGENNI
jgi:hypothetical protein